MSLNKQIVRLAVPSILANITIPLVGLVDTAIVGHISNAAAIGGIAIGTMLFDLLYWNFGFLRVGTSGMTAQAYGRESRVESQESIGWAEAHRQVYYSKLAGLITPWRLGEYPARGLLMQKNSLSQEKEQVSSKTLWTKVLTMGAVGSATMTIAIVIGGLIGLAVVGSPVNLGDNYIIILLGVLVGAVLLIAAGWKIRTVILSSYSSPSVHRRVTVGIICKNILQSIVRLLCWCVQLGLLLYALDGLTALTEIPGVTEITGLTALTGLTAIYYLLVTITPNVPIAEIGVRGAWAIAVFGTPQAAIAAVVLWVINTLLPCVGWLFLRKKTIKFA